MRLAAVVVVATIGGATVATQVGDSPVGGTVPTISPTDGSGPGPANGVRPRELCPQRVLGGCRLLVG
jgi:hypothetical protein